MRVRNSSSVISIRARLITSVCGVDEILSSAEFKEKLELSGIPSIGEFNDTRLSQ